MTETTTGDGWAVGSIDGLGQGPGFRKIRKELGVEAFGVNAVVHSKALSWPDHGPGNPGVRHRSSGRRGRRKQEPLAEGNRGRAAAAQPRPCASCVG